MTPYCWLVRRRLDAYQDGELSPGVRSRVASHVEGCESCARDLAALGRLRAALTQDPVDPSEAVWAAFWPEVRARIAATAPVPEPVWRQAWAAVRSRPRLGLAPALAAGALAVLAVVAPWQRAPREAPAPAPASVAGGPEVAGVQPAALDQVVIQSIETEDPDVPVMVYASPESDVTVLWVFGLPRTGV
jgi:anti-sigma factor RsiW